MTDYGSDVMKCQACRREQTRQNLTTRAGRKPCCAYCGDTRVKLLRAHTHTTPVTQADPDNSGPSLLEGIVDAAIDIGLSSFDSTPSTPDFEPGGGDFGGGGASGDW